MSEREGKSSPPRADMMAHWGLSNEKDYLVIASSDYAVWLDEKGDLDWETTSALDTKVASGDEKRRFNEALNRAAVLRAYPRQHLTAENQRAYMIMVGEGLGRALELEDTCATKMFDKAEEFAVARNSEVARVWYLSASGTATLIVIGIVFIGVYNLCWLSLHFGEQAGRLLILSGFGSVGAFFSVVRRLGGIGLDPAAGRILHSIEGVGRIVVGVIGAGVAILAVKLGLALTVLSDKGDAALLLIAVVSGLSEKLVRSLVKKVEISSEDRDSPAK